MSRRASKRQLNRHDADALPSPLEAEAPSPTAPCRSNCSGWSVADACYGGLARLLSRTSSLKPCFSRRTVQPTDWRICSISRSVFTGSDSWLGRSVDVAVCPSAAYASSLPASPIADCAANAGQWRRGEHQQGASIDSRAARAIRPPDPPNLFTSQVWIGRLRTVRVTSRLWIDGAFSM